MNASSPTVHVPAFIGPADLQLPPTQPIAVAELARTKLGTTPPLASNTLCFGDGPKVRVAAQRRPTVGDNARGRAIGEI